MKCVKGGSSVGIGGSVGWGVDRGVVSAVNITDGITFGLDDKYGMGFSDGFFDG